VSADDPISLAADTDVVPRGNSLYNTEKPVRLTSHAAFRIYAGQVDALVAEFCFGRASESETWQAWDYAEGNLVAALRAAFARGLEAVNPTAEAPADEEQPLAGPG